MPPVRPRDQNLSKGISFGASGKFKLVLTSIAIEDLFHGSKTLGNLLLVL